MFHGGLFADDAAKARANGCAEEWRRYAFGLAIVESKRWTRPLDSRSDGQARTAPSTQMLRYLRRVDDLTNGAQWRLYYAGARSVSEEGCVATLRGGLLVVWRNGEEAARKGGRPSSSSLRGLICALALDIGTPRRSSSRRGARIWGTRVC